ncbi:MAG: hypothetical protein JWQ54_1775 [Mucilaginibacter sp.]|nr:hypothetical protein [Mucilaginibacter sp.]
MICVSETQSIASLREIILITPLGKIVHLLAYIIHVVKSGVIAHLYCQYRRIKL